MCGMQVVSVKTRPNGNLDIDDLRTKAEQYKDRLAAFMVTYPCVRTLCIYMLTFADPRMASSSRRSRRPTRSSTRMAVKYIWTAPTCRLSLDLRTPANAALMSAISICIRSVASAGCAATHELPDIWHPSWRRRTWSWSHLRRTASRSVSAGTSTRANGRRAGHHSGLLCAVR
jgi:hypothetical protein